MIKKSMLSLLVFVMLGTFLTACLGSTGISAEDQVATAKVMAATIIQATKLASIPTATNTLPPTLTPTATQVFTATVTSSPTVYVTDTPAYVAPTPTDTPFVASYKETPLKFVNQTNKDVYFKFTSPITDEFDATGGYAMKVPFGNYKFLAWVGEEGPFSGTINAKGFNKIEIWFREDKVKIVYP